MFAWLKKPAAEAAMIETDVDALEQKLTAEIEPKIKKGFAAIDAAARKAAAIVEDDALIVVGRIDKEIATARTDLQHMADDISTRIAKLEADHAATIADHNAKLAAVQATLARVEKAVAPAPAVPAAPTVDPAADAAAPAVA